MRFAQYAKETPSRIVLDEAAQPVLRQAARLGDPGNLEQSGGRRNVGIEPARRGGDEIDRNLGGRIRRRQQSRTSAAYPLDQRFRRRTIVRARRIARIIGRGHGFGRIIRIGVGRGGRPSMKIVIAREILPDQFRADDLSVAFDQTALGLIGEKEAGQSRHRERIGKPGQRPSSERST